MIMLVQRVEHASVTINNEIYNQINNGLLVLVGIHKNDNLNDIEYLINKLIGLRIFNDDQNKMNLSVKDVNGELMIISQFTLIANTKRGLRPSFTEASEPSSAQKLYNILLQKLNQYNLIVKSGKFGADMKVQLNNIGPATFILNSKN